MQAAADDLWLRGQRMGRRQLLQEARDKVEREAWDTIRARQRHRQLAEAAGPRVALLNRRQVMQGVDAAESVEAGMRLEALQRQQAALKLAQEEAQLLDAQVCLSEWPCAFANVWPKFRMVRRQSSGVKLRVFESKVCALSSVLPIVLPSAITSADMIAMCPFAISTEAYSSAYGCPWAVDAPYFLAFIIVDDTSLEFPLHSSCGC